MTLSDSNQSVDFIRAAVMDDLKAGRYTRVHTRFPPEPNGYLHIGHAKAICIDFGIAAEFGGQCNLRFDDTNPVKEDVEYVESIQQDIRWLGFDWEDRLYYASDYFGQLYEYAVMLIRKGKAYVCDLSADEIRDYRGTLTEPGKESPYRNRTVDENLDLFARMRAGRISGRLAHPARQNRHGLRQHQSARPGDVPHHPCRASPHGRRVVHLSDVRLRPWPVGLHRGHHPLVVLAGVRRPSAAVQLVSRCAGDLPPSPDRIRAPQRLLHRAEQAQALAAGAGRAREGLGRPAHAHALRPAPSGVHAGSHPRFL